MDGFVRGCPVMDGWLQLRQCGHITTSVVGDPVTSWLDQSCRYCVGGGRPRDGWYCAADDASAIQRECHDLGLGSQDDQICVVDVVTMLERDLAKGWMTPSNR